MIRNCARILSIFPGRFALTPIAVLTGMALPMATAAFATDRYESTLGAGVSDDTYSTFLESIHGRLRTHDLQDVGGLGPTWTGASSRRRRTTRTRRP